MKDDRIGFRLPTESDPDNPNSIAPSPTPSAAAELAPRTGPAIRRRLYIDATGFLALQGTVLTGIPRLEDFLVRSAAADPDPSVQLVLFDRGLCAYRRLSALERRSLDRTSSEQTPHAANRSAGPRALLRRALRTVRANPFAGKEFERQVAAKIADHRRRGPAYAIVKNLIRGYRYIYHLAFYLRRFLGSLSRHAIEEGSGIVLMSNMVMLGRAAPQRDVTPGARAFICHDLIPVLHAELTSNDRLVQTFKQSVTALVRSGALAICNSDSTRAMLERFVGAVAGGSALRIDRFPMPSMLYEKARSLGRTARLEAAEPFVLYCSTVEVRKNHLMLLRVWDQALEAGVALPKLVCAGSWGWKNQALQAYLDAHPQLADCVAFVGAVDDLELIDRYRGALFGVMPSRVEGWGLGASECLDFGTPVIVSTAPALLEATGGLMPAVDPDDQAGWYAAIRRLAENETDRDALHARIAAEYRPVTAEASWQAIKAAMRRADGIDGR